MHIVESPSNIKKYDLNRENLPCEIFSDLLLIFPPGAQTHPPN